MFRASSLVLISMRTISFSNNIMNNDNPTVVREKKSRNSLENVAAGQSWLGRSMIANIADIPKIIPQNQRR